MHDASQNNFIFDGASPNASNRQDMLVLEQSAAHSATADTITASQSAFRHAECNSAEIQASAIGALNTQQASLEQSAVGALSADHAEVNTSSLYAVYAQNLHINEKSIVGLMIARTIHGTVRPLIDWRGAILIGLILGLIFSVGRRGNANNDH